MGSYELVDPPLGLIIQIPTDTATGPDFDPTWVEPFSQTPDRNLSIGNDLHFILRNLSRYELFREQQSK